MNPLCKLLPLILLVTATAFAEGPPPLGRIEAQRLLEHMEWRAITILAIRQGVNDKGDVAPIYATVVAFGTRDAKDLPVCQTFTFDRDLGWHLLEVGDKAARLWTKDGYTEIKPWGTWIRTVPK